MLKIFYKKKKSSVINNNFNLILTSTKVEKNVTGGISRYQNDLKEALSKNSNVEILDIPPPRYLRRYYFSFNYFLKCAWKLLKVKHTKLIICDPQISMLTLAGLLISRSKTKYIISHGWMMHTKEFLYLKKIFFYFCRIFILPRFTKVVCISKQDFGLCKKLSNKVLLENCLGIESSAKDYQIQRQNIILIYGRNSVSKNTSRTINILKILNDIQDFKSE